MESFWVDPRSRAALQAAEWRLTGRTADALLMDRIAARPQAEWLNGPGVPGGGAGPHRRRRTTGTYGRTRRVLHPAPRLRFLLGRRGLERGLPEVGRRVRAGLGDRDAYVIVEPDAVAQTVAGCVSVVAEERYALLAYAVDRLKRQPGTRVYLDAGNSAWLPDTSRLVEPLTQSGIARADGFALNVSNFQTDAAIRRTGIGCRRLSAASTS